MSTLIQDNTQHKNDSNNKRSQDNKQAFEQTLAWANNAEKTKLQRNPYIIWILLVSLSVIVVIIWLVLLFIYRDKELLATQQVTQLQTIEAARPQQQSAIQPLVESSRRD